MIHLQYQAYSRLELLHLFKERKLDAIITFEYPEIKDENHLLLKKGHLRKYYHQKVIILIDEYDVPLQSAYQYNYYDEMVEFLKNVFSSALKTNESLEKDRKSVV